MTEYPTLNKYLESVTPEPEKITPEFRYHAISFYELGRSTNGYENSFLYYHLFMDLFENIIYKYINPNYLTLYPITNIKVSNTTPGDNANLTDFLSPISIMTNEAFKCIPNIHNTKDISSVVRSIESMEKLRGSFMLGSGKSIKEVIEDFKKSLGKN